MKYDYVQMILLLLPVMLIHIGLVLISLLDLKKRKRAVLDNKPAVKWAWISTIILICIVGPSIYLVIRGDE
jgi:hypothetical protein